MDVSNNQLEDKIQQESIQFSEKLKVMHREISDKFQVDPKEKVLLVDGKNQLMYLVDMNTELNYSELNIHKSYSISTGKNGFGCEDESEKTPIGIHRINEKIGYEFEKGTIIEARKNTGKIHPLNTRKDSNEKSYMTSRIMRLIGCEKHNENTFSRYIYIHGTSDEDSIGTPKSKGCIRMNNDQVIELFELIKTGTYLNIKE